MPENLTIRFQSITSEEVTAIEWLVLNDLSNEVKFQGEGSIDELASYIEESGFSGQIRLLASGENFLLTSTRVPSRKLKKVIQAVPFAVEEELACEIEECHFSIGNISDEGEAHVAVVNRHELENWLKVLSEQNIILDNIKVDVLQLPLENQPVILIDKDRLLFRRSKERGQAADIAMLPILSRLSNEVKESGVQILAANFVPEMSADAVAGINARPLGMSALEFLSRNYDPNGIEILQGQYKPQKKNSPSDKPVWRNAAIVCVSALVLHLSSVLAQGIYLNSEANEFASASKVLYLEVFPHDKNVRDIRRRWRSHLSGGSGAVGDFMELFAIAGSKITESGLKLENINFNDSRGDLTLRIQAPRSEDLVTLSEKLNDEGLVTRIGSISQEENFVRGTLKLENEIRK